tara:strand:- start:108 stop:1148 length:1041 start_codon:yes stop_codon:yes gene_type:complete
MYRFNLNQNQFSDFINITNNVFFPLTNFVNKREYSRILRHKKINNSFFPFPILFGLMKNQYETIKKKDSLLFYYNNKKIAEVKKLNFFSINKKNFGKTIYGKNFASHPYFKKINENYKFLSFKISKEFNLMLNENIFISPKNFKKKINRKIHSNMSSFHTRNVPHKAHQWIHKYLLSKSSALLIQPLIGQYKNGEYRDQIILKLNKIAANSYNKKTTFVIPFYSYPRYGGPREAALHAIVRKNYGCKYIWIGRDHAGYKNFFKKYESQKFCKKNEKILGIKIINEKEPYYCKNEKKILNYCFCKKNCKVLISGSKIRNYLKNSKKIPEFLINKKLSKLLNVKSLVK